MLDVASNAVNAVTYMASTNKKVRTWNGSTNACRQWNGRGRRWNSGRSRVMATVAMKGRAKNKPNMAAMTIQPVRTSGKAFTISNGSSAHKMEETVEKKIRNVVKEVRSL